MNFKKYHVKVVFDSSNSDLIPECSSINGTMLHKQNNCQATTFLFLHHAKKKNWVGGPSKIIASFFFLLLLFRPYPYNQEFVRLRSVTQVVKNWLHLLTARAGHFNQKVCKNWFLTSKYYFCKCKRHLFVCLFVWISSSPELLEA